MVKILLSKLKGGLKTCTLISFIDPMTSLLEHLDSYKSFEIAFWSEVPISISKIFLRILLGYFKINTVFQNICKYFTFHLMVMPIFATFVANCQMAFRTKVFTVYGHQTFHAQKFRRDRRVVTILGPKIAAFSCKMIVHWCLSRQLNIFRPKITLSLPRNNKVHFLNILLEVFQTLWMGNGNLLQDQNVFENVLDSNKVIGIYGMSVQTVANTGNNPFCQWSIQIDDTFFKITKIFLLRNQFLKQKAFVEMIYWRNVILDMWVWLL